MKAIRIYEQGGPEILLITDVATPEPHAKEVVGQFVQISEA